ncbi:HAD superfamily phosphatase [Parasitella parasitica]|nr:HAD superfamily phosphatase [Parasitella parasitica]
MPHIIVDDIRQINFRDLKSQAKIKAIGFDKDNCLTAPYVSTIYPLFKEAWIECKDTFSKENAQKLEESLGVAVLRHDQKKPSGGQIFKERLAPIPADQVAFAGDRILTDILFGNRNGNLTIWTRKIITEEGDNKAALIVSTFYNNDCFIYKGWGGVYFIDATYGIQVD